MRIKVVYIFKIVYVEQNYRKRLSSFLNRIERILHFYSVWKPCNIIVLGKIPYLGV